MSEENLNPFPEPESYEEAYTLVVERLTVIKEEIKEIGQLDPKEAADRAKEHNYTVFLLCRLIEPAIQEQILQSWASKKSGWRGEINMDELRAELHKKIMDMCAGTKIVSEGRPVRKEPYFSNREGVVMPLEWLAKQLPVDASMVENHEKTHHLTDESSFTIVPVLTRGRDISFGARMHMGKYLPDMFDGCFDPTKIKRTKRSKNTRINQIKRSLKKEHIANPTLGPCEYTDEELERAEEEDFQIYLFSPVEILSRMSQLKSFFGLSANEKFTKEHLHYAQKNYSKFFKSEDEMKHFLKSITPETEDRFLEVINSIGI